MDIWGNGNESMSSTLSTCSSTNSRDLDQDSHINVMAARKRIVERIMEKKRAEERQRDQLQLSHASSLASGDNVFKRPSSRIASHNSIIGEGSMELTRVDTTSPGKENRSTKARLPPRGAPVYRSTPLPGRSSPAKLAVPLFPPSDDEALPESIEPEAEISPRSGLRSSRRSPAASPRRTPTKPSGAEQPTVKTSKKQKTLVTNARVDQSPLEENSPSRAKTKSNNSTQSQPKSSQKAAATTGRPLTRRAKATVTKRQSTRLSNVASKEMSVEQPSPPPPPPSPSPSPSPPPSPHPSPTPTPTPSPTPSPTPPLQDAHRPQQRSAEKKRSTGKKSPAQSLSEPNAAAASSNSRVGGSFRRKNKPKKSTVESKFKKTFIEIRRLQSETGYLLPRLSFMRVVREISAQVSATGENYKFTVDAMEAIQTAAEFYVSNVFADAFRLAIHAKRITVMPKDLDLLRTLKIIDS